MLWKRLTYSMTEFIQLREKSFADINVNKPLKRECQASDSGVKQSLTTN